MERWGWPMGPAYLMDVVGIDTGVHAAEVMAEGFFSSFLLFCFFTLPTLLHYSLPLLTSSFCSLLFLLYRALNLILFPLIVARPLSHASRLLVW